MFLSKDYNYTVYDSYDKNDIAKIKELIKKFDDCLAVYVNDDLEILEIRCRYSKQMSKGHLESEYCIEDNKWNPLDDFPGRYAIVDDSFKNEDIGFTYVGDDIIYKNYYELQVN